MNAITSDIRILNPPTIDKVVFVFINFLFLTIIQKSTDLVGLIDLTNHNFELFEKRICKFVCNRLHFTLLCIPTLLFGQQTIIKEIKIKPYKYTQNYEHFKRLILDSPNSEASYVDGFDFEWGYFYILKVKEIYLVNSQMELIMNILC